MSYIYIYCPPPKKKKKKKKKKTFTLTLVQQGSVLLEAVGIRMLRRFRHGKQTPSFCQ